MVEEKVRRCSLQNVAYRADQIQKRRAELGELHILGPRDRS